MPREVIMPDRYRTVDLTCLTCGWTYRVRHRVPEEYAKHERRAVSPAECPHCRVVGEVEVWPVRGGSR